MIERSFHLARHARRAFTLLEVMLTLALLVIVTALAWPALEKPFSTVRLRTAADEVRAALTTARAAAINTGEIHLFRFTVEGGTYRIECYSPLAEAGLEVVGQGGGGLGTPGSPIEKSLPKDVTFYSLENVADSRQSMTVANVDASGMGLQTTSFDESWSEPILFYPDGTTTTSTLVLKNDRDRFIQVDLRGLTGAITVSRVMSAESGGFGR